MPSLRSVSGFVLVAILLSPSEAHLSGSSTVFSDSKYFRVSIESVRKIFAYNENEPNREGDWHAEWRKNNQPRVNQLRARLEPAFPSLVESYGLRPFKPGLPEVEEGNEEDRWPLACAPHAVGRSGPTGDMDEH